eukprot:4974624-Prymnesium_polylepis.1
MLQERVDVGRGLPRGREADDTGATRARALGRCAQQQRRRRARYGYSDAYNTFELLRGCVTHG